MAAFAAAFFMSAPVAAIMNAGDAIFIRLGCDRESIFRLAGEDEKSSERAVAMAEMLVQEGGCFVVPFPAAVRLKTLLHVYSSNWDGGQINEIWEIETSGKSIAIYIIVQDPKQNSRYSI
jgi:hypothetical protein